MHGDLLLLESYSFIALIDPKTLHYSTVKNIYMNNYIKCFNMLWLLDFEIFVLEDDSETFRTI